MLYANRAASKRPRTDEPETSAAAMEEDHPQGGKTFRFIRAIKEPS